MSKANTARNEADPFRGALVPFQTRLPAAASTSTQSLREERSRLQEVMKTVARDIERQRFDEAHKAFWEASHRLRDLVRVEEEQLFPQLRNVTGLAAGPLAVMHRGHLRIEKLLARVVRALVNRDAQWAAHSLEALLGELAAHDHEERGTLYAIVDQIAGEVGCAGA